MEKPKSTSKNKQAPQSGYMIGDTVKSIEWGYTASVCARIGRIIIGTHIDDKKRFHTEIFDVEEIILVRH